MDKGGRRRRRRREKGGGGRKEGGKGEERGSAESRKVRNRAEERNKLAGSAASDPCQCCSAVSPMLA